MQCERCNEGKAAWIVRSDEMKLRVCDDCGLDGILNTAQGPISRMKVTRILPKKKKSPKVLDR